MDIELTTTLKSGTENSSLCYHAVILFFYLCLNTRKRTDEHPKQSQQTSSWLCCKKK